MSVFPFINPEVFIGDTSSGELERYCEYAYDFEKNRLKTKDGKNYYVYENEALLIWIYKALITERYRYIPYSRAFGSELDSLIGGNLEKGILQSELKRYITEALMVNPYIKELGNFTFGDDTQNPSVSFSCATLYGTMELALKGGGDTWNLAHQT